MGWWYETVFRYSDRVGEKLINGVKVIRGNSVVMLEVRRGFLALTATALGYWHNVLTSGFSTGTGAYWWGQG